MASYAEMSNEQLMAKMTDGSTSSEELENIMAFLASKDAEANSDIASIESRLKEQEGGAQLGEGLTGMHDAMDAMSAAVTEYATVSAQRHAKWDLLQEDDKSTMKEWLRLSAARLELLYSVRVDIGNIADKLIPKTELDETKDPWEEMARFNKEVEATEAEFKKEAEKVSSFTKAYHEMPEYKELTEKMEVCKARMATMQAEFSVLMAADDQDCANVAKAMKIVEEAGKNL